MADGKDSGSKPPPASPPAVAAKPAGGTTGMGGASPRPWPPMQDFTRVQSNDSDPFARPKGSDTGNSKSRPSTPTKGPGKT